MKKNTILCVFFLSSTEIKREMSHNLEIDMVVHKPEFDISLARIYATVESNVKLKRCGTKNPLYSSARYYRDPLRSHRGERMGTVIITTLDRLLHQGKRMPPR